MTLRLPLALILIWLHSSVIAQVGRCGGMEFENTPLEEAFAQLEQRCGVVVSYNPENTEGITVTARIPEGDLESTLSALFRGIPLKYEILGGEDILVKPAPALAEAAPPPPPVPTIRLCGYVRDALSGDPLEYASVAVLGSPLGATTNTEGEFRFSGAFSLSDSVQIQYVGYEPLLLSISSFIRGACESYHLDLYEQIIPAVTVVDRSLQLLSSHQDGIGYRLRPSEIGSLPGLGEPDVLRAAQLLSGVSSADESATGINIRGGSPDQSLILWDGIPVYHTGHFFGSFSSFNPHVVDNVRVYKGGFGAEYGGRASGIIDIEGKPASNDSLHLAAGGNLLNAHAYAQIPIRKLKSTLLVAGRRAYTDFVQSPTYQQLFANVNSSDRIRHAHGDLEDDTDDNEQAVNLVPEYSFYDLNFKWVAETSDKTDLGFSYYRSTDHINHEGIIDIDDEDEDEEGEQPFYFNINDQRVISNYGLALNWEQRWAERWTSKAHFHHSSYENNHNHQYSFLKNANTPVRGVEQTNQLEETNLKISAQRRFNTWRSLRVGYDATQYKVDLLLRDYGGGQLVDEMGNNDKVSVHTLFADYDLNWRGRFMLDMGFRYNYAHSANDHTFEPRLSFRWRPLKSCKLYVKGSAGVYYQFINQIFTKSPVTPNEKLWTIQAGAPSAAPDGKHKDVAHSKQTSLGLLYREGGFLFEVEGYFKRTVGISSLGLQPTNPYPDTTGISHACGLDVLLKKQWKWYDLWASYSLARVNNHFEGINNGNWFPASHDQRHIISLANVVKNEHFEVSLTWNYASGRPVSIPVGTRESMRGDDIIYKPHYDGINASRLPHYHRMDGNVAWLFRSKRSPLRGKLGATVFNLYNRKNIKDKTFIVEAPEDDGDEEEDEVPELLQINRNMLGFTPNVYFILEW